MGPTTPKLSYAKALEKGTSKHGMASGMPITSAIGPESSLPGNGIGSIASNNIRGRTPSSSLLFPISGGKVGLVIGKQGETAKKLQGAFGVKIEVIQRDKFSTEDPKKLKISGKEDAIGRAWNAIQRFLNGEPLDWILNSNPAEEFEALSVPKKTAKYLAGKKGKTYLEQFRRNSGANIVIEQYNPSHPEQRRVYIGGTAAQCEEAKKQISGLLTPENSDGGTRPSSADSGFSSSSEEDLLTYRTLKNFSPLNEVYEKQLTPLEKAFIRHFRTKEETFKEALLTDHVLSDESKKCFRQLAAEYEQLIQNSGTSIPRANHSPRTYLALASVFLAIRDRRMCAEAIWASAAMAVKNYAQRVDKSLALHKHDHLGQFCGYVIHSLDENLIGIFNMAEICHSRGFYDDKIGEEVLRTYKKNVEDFVGKLEELAVSGPVVEQGLLDFRNCLAEEEQEEQQEMK